MTDDERHRYHNAFRTLMETGIFDEIAVIHLYMVAKTHGKSVFWTWHRGYLKKYTKKLKNILVLLTSKHHELGFLDFDKKYQKIQ
jgi:hypothetical protein